MGYGVGLIGLIGVKILAPGFYARQDIRTPVTIAVIVLVLTQAMNVVFVPLFGHAGLALSISLGAMINAVWLFIGLKRGGWYQPAPGWGRFALQVVFATLALERACWPSAAVNIDWVGLAGRDAAARRAGWPPAWAAPRSSTSASCSRPGCDRATSRAAPEASPRRRMRPARGSKLLP